MSYTVLERVKRLIDFDFGHTKVSKNTRPPFCAKIDDKDVMRSISVVGHLLDEYDSILVNFDGRKILVLECVTTAKVSGGRLKSGAFRVSDAPAAGIVSGATRIRTTGNAPTAEPAGDAEPTDVAEPTGDVGPAGDTQPAGNTPPNTPPEETPTSGAPPNEQPAATLNTPSDNTPNPQLRYFEILWPKKLLRFLDGKSTITVTDGRTSETLAEKELNFAPRKTLLETVKSIGKNNAPKRVKIEDLSGRPLSFSKWGILDHAVMQDEPLKQKLIVETKKLVKVLTEHGYNVAISSGTLLGAIRNNGKMIPTDDDSDLLIYFDTDDITEINLRMIELQHTLERLGYNTLYSAGGFIQTSFIDKNGIYEFYIDIFAGFFKDSYYWQYFALKAPLKVEDIYPFSEVEFEGSKVLAPGKPIKWLESLYGKNWRVPDPAFQFERSYDMWFKYFSWFENDSENFGHNYWEMQHSLPETLGRPVISVISDTVKKYVPAGHVMLDIGSGSGEVSAAMEQLGHSVLAVDYSYAAVVKTKKRLSSKSSANWLNILKRDTVLEMVTDIQADQESKGRVYSIVASDFHTFTNRGRKVIFEIATRVLKDDARLIIAYNTNFDLGIFVNEEMLTWHYNDDMLEREFSLFDLEIVHKQDFDDDTENGPRPGRVLVIKKK
jgi:SAM-dependent methyltransferase